MHIRKDAPKGKMYRKKGIDNEFASTVFLGNGVSIDDYEPITIEEYNKIQEEQTRRCYETNNL